MRLLRPAATLSAAAVFGLAGIGAASAATASSSTGPTGPFGFTTQGLGTGPQYGEPSIAIAPDGKHVAISTPGGDANGNGTVQIWHSSDDGATFAHTYNTAPNGGGDSELDFLPNGDLLSADLEITDSYVQESSDFGATWTAIGAVGGEMDRQWFAHSPDGSTEFLVYHDFAAEGEFYAKGTCSLATHTCTFAKQDAAHPVVDPMSGVTAPGVAVTPTKGSPASLADQGGNTFSGPMLVSPDGKDLYVVYSISDLGSNTSTSDGVPPYGPTRGIVVMHSADGGTTWTSHYAVTAAPSATSPAGEDTNGAIFPWGTMDRAGNLYIVYNSAPKGSDNYRQMYTYSTDKGATWSTPVELDDLDAAGATTGAAIYATGAAGAPGVLDVAWYQSDNGSPSSTASTVTWTPHFAQVTAANTAHPSVAEQAITTVPNHKSGICLQGILCGIAAGSADRSLADFFELAINPVTGLAEIAYSDNAGVRGGGSQVVFAQQTAGPSALASVGADLPETTTAVLLPVAAMTVLGLGILARRRHGAAAAA